MPPLTRMSDSLSQLTPDKSSSIDGVRISSLPRWSSFLPVQALIFIGFQLISRWLVDCEIGSMPETLSNQYESARFQGILEARIAELERGVRQRDGIAIEQSRDQLDEIQRASERDLAISNIDRGSRQLRDARAALRRIRDGSFGLCQECEEEIHLKRLAAIPWASLCIHCQENLDRREAMSTDSTLGKAA